MIKAFRDTWRLGSYSAPTFAGMVIRDKQEIYLS